MMNFWLPLGIDYKTLIRDGSTASLAKLPIYPIPDTMIETGVNKPI